MRTRNAFIKQDKKPLKNYFRNIGGMLPKLIMSKAACLPAVTLPALKGKLLNVNK